MEVEKEAVEAVDIEFFSLLIFIKRRGKHSKQIAKKIIYFVESQKS